MRKIKFRGLTDNNEWVFGYLLRKPYASFSIVDKDGVEHANINPESIAQFVGTDKNGDELYDGDKVAYEHDGELYKSTIRLHPSTWTHEEARLADEEFLLRHHALTD